VLHKHTRNSRFDFLTEEDSLAILRLSARQNTVHKLLLDAGAHGTKHPGLVSKMPFSTEELQCAHLEHVNFLVGLLDDFLDVCIQKPAVYAAISFPVPICFIAAGWDAQVRAK